MAEIRTSTDSVTVEQVTEATGWPLRVAADLTAIPRPTAAELTALRTFREAR
ncbi:hypothetical protein [Nocardia australiensis]|uniref:hypothetical protein n=1 Tax=Nocardia australiensis TaxID=2887191 RepID=UPI001D1599B5|nr:hypothetical protein [Nocardia australiensis]